MAVISLLSDFGLADTYVGQVKGAILAVAPHATLVDLAHGVPAQDVLAGAFLLWSAVEAFSAGAIHLAVVDPGVGSARRAIAVRSARGDFLVGPDNGLLMPAVQRLGGSVNTVELTEPAFWRQALPGLSGTFHGRDLLGPVAGHLASGVPLERLGRPLQDPVPLAFPEATRRQGEVIHVDTYGNLITNLPAASLPERFIVRLDEYRVAYVSHYAAAPEGSLLAVIGSAGLLEIAARNASAASKTGARRGTVVRLEPV